MDGLEIIPDSIEPIVGWRFCALTASGDIYSPIFMHQKYYESVSLHYWAPGEKQKAFCGQNIKHTEQIPDIGCKCGFYARPSFELLLRREGSCLEFPNLYMNNRRIFMEAYMWGKVIEGARGFRAQYVYPKTIYMNTKMWSKNTVSFKNVSLRRKIEKDWQVPVRDYRELI